MRKTLNAVQSLNEVGLQHNLGNHGIILDFFTDSDGSHITYRIKNNFFQKTRLFQIEWGLKLFKPSNARQLHLFTNAVKNTKHKIHRNYGWLLTVKSATIALDALT